MIYKQCFNYDGDDSCHKCCSPNHDKYILSCPAECKDYRDIFGHELPKESDDYVKRSDVHKVFQPKYAPAINKTFTAMIDSVPAADVVEVVRCRDCKHRIVNEHYGEKGYLKLKAICKLDTGDPFELGRNAEDDDWFCADGEYKDGGQDDAHA